jgi:pimeloyl-ACP methyl ester carboxylesterase
MATEMHARLRRGDQRAARRSQQLPEPAGDTDGGLRGREHGGMAGTFGMPGVEALRLRTNGIELHAVAAGPPDGPLVVLLHGFPEFWYGWRRQIAPLAVAGLRILAPDQRGYNLSDKPAGVAAYCLDPLADDVLGLADALGHERFAVVGHDWGGVVAWHLAARNPERVERAAVLNAPHPATVRDFMRAHPSQALRSWYAAFFQTPLLPEWALGAAEFAWLRASLVRTSRPGTFLDADLRRYRDAWAQPGALTAMLNWYRALPRHAGAPRRGRIRVPVRVIWGDRDPFLDRGLVEAGLALCDRGDAFHIADATHWVQHEEPERVNGLLAEFLI